MNGNIGRNTIRTQKLWTRVTEPRDSPGREAVLGQKPEGHHLGEEQRKENPQVGLRSQKNWGKTRKVQRHRMLHKGGREK